MKKFTIVVSSALCASLMAMSAAAASESCVNYGKNCGVLNSSNSVCQNGINDIANGNVQKILQNIFGFCSNIDIPQCPVQPESPDLPDAPVIPETPESPSVPDNDGDTGVSDSVSAYEQRVAELVNAERAKQGLNSLILNTELSNVARVKSQDMLENSYFSHTSPTYGSPFDMLKAFGISYSTAGENIAKGYSTPEAVVEGWMNSEGHRANILNGSFTKIGVGYVSNGNYWTQMFIG